MVDHTSCITEDMRGLKSRYEAINGYFACLKSCRMWKDEYWMVSTNQLQVRQIGRALKQEYSSIGWRNNEWKVLNQYCNCGLFDKQEIMSDRD